MKKSILSAVLCFWIAYLKVCDKDGGLSPCICGNCDPELPLGMGRAFRIALQAETTSQISASEWDAVSRSGLKRKLHPGTSPQSGMNFPNGAACGSCVPELPLRTGRAFRMACLAETTAQFLAPERDTFSGTVHMRWGTAPFACVACRITL